MNRLFLDGRKKRMNDMIPELELLFKKSMEQSDITRWLMDQDSVRRHNSNCRRTDEDCERLNEILSGKELELFERFVDNQVDCFVVEQQMLFSQGVCVGLRLGSLCGWNCW